MYKHDILKKVSVSMITLLCLTAFVLFLFRDNWGEISGAFKVLSAPDILRLFGLGTSYQLLDGLVCWCLVRTAVPTFTYRQALEVIYLGVFGRSSTFGAGTIPMQAYHLHRYGIEVGRGVGIMTFSYTLHKMTIVLYVSVLMLFERKWFRTAIPNLHAYLIAGYLICLTIIVILLLLCTWNRAHSFALWLLRKLPDNGKWIERKLRIRRQLDCLYHETAAFLKNKRIVLMVVFTHAIKLSILCAIPYTCMRILGANTIALMQVELLTALMLLIAGAVPNVAGMGPTEAVFFMIYSPILGNALTASSLLLFRISTYYFPFLVSVFAFLIIHIRLLSSSKSKEVQKNGKRCH